MTEAGVAKLQALRVTDVYDLRSRQEIDRDARNGHGRQPKEWPGATRIFAPVFLDDDYSPEAIAVRFKNYADKTSEVSRTCGVELTVPSPTRECFSCVQLGAVT